LAFKNLKLKLTVGAEGEAAQEISKIGHEHIQSNASECVIDDVNKIATTGAYMFDHAPMADIFNGISSVVKFVIA
jgi:enhancing lycopene biosynthesis protein 2